MELTPLIQIFLFIPLLGFIISLMIPARNEMALSRIAFYTAGTNLVLFLGFLMLWLLQSAPTLNLKEFSLYQNKDYEFLIDFFFDKITAVYLFVGALLTFLITIYSRYYLHRETGYKRFFNTILFFYLGYNITIFAGNFETLFIGWEILGISSFLLIAFYRDRYLPVRNAVKVFSVYRIGDVGILLAMWASHHLWHENITFLKLNNYELVHEHLAAHSSIGLFISLMILLAAAAKSAQLPFSSWLPRAMEGPTPSSAIFYGSLSVHFGVFLLLRTYPFWEHQIIVRVLIGLLGLSTAAVASAIGRVQSSIKTQIAYASIAQIGLIFIEIALGWGVVALIHFAGNAFLRTYQLLISPSVVTYLIREQFYHYQPRTSSVEDTFPKKLEYSVYLLSLREWNLDTITNKLIFSPLKKLGRRLDFLTYRNVFYYVIPAFIIGVALFMWEEKIPHQIHQFFPYLFSFIGLLMVLKSFSERKYPRLAWLLVIFNHFWIALAVSFNEHFDFHHTAIYLSGIVVAGVAGLYFLQKLKNVEPKYFSLNEYYGHAYEYPKMSTAFLICSLGVMGFPISASFIGEDLIFSHIHEEQFFLAFFNSISFVMGGISLVRVYARLFLGPHIKTYHETSLKSA
jgi:NADH:ubiquinone oxidoreductase subunit 5 (subunit L)/multisubunit Na+/H+ antiporter MnhA subunit